MDERRSIHGRSCVAQGPGFELSGGYAGAHRKDRARGVGPHIPGLIGQLAMFAALIAAGRVARVLGLRSGRDAGLDDHLEVAERQGPEHGGLEC